MFVVEFVGSPGSGKTAIATRLAKSLVDAKMLDEAVRESISEQGYDPVVRLAARAGGPVWRFAYPRSHDRFAALARFTASRPEVVEVAAAAHSEKRRRGVNRDGSIPFILNFFARFQLVEESMPEDTIVIMDEGFAQRGIMVFGHGFGPADEPILQRYIEACPRPNVLVHVATPQDACIARVDRRGWTTGTLGRESLSRSDFINSSAAIAQRLADHPFAIAAVLRIDGSGSLDTAVIDVAEQIANVQR